jgi:hypothetical protein
MIAVKLRGPRTPSQPKNQIASAATMPNVEMDDPSCR